MFGDREKSAVYKVLPDFAQELEELLPAASQPELAAQIPELRIARRCPCEGDFCRSFYRQFEPSKRKFANARCIEVDPSKGMIILDIVSG